MTSTAPPSLPRAHALALAAAAGLVPLNSTMIAVALPAISDEFSVSTSAVSVLITTYLVVMFVGQPFAGRLGDRIGSRRLVRLALGGLAVMSAAAALAPTFWFLVVARALQAICASALTPGIQSLLTSLTAPDDRGGVFGDLGSVLGAGAASGPIVGGILIEAFGWEAIFAVNVPITLVAMWTVHRLQLRSTDPDTDGVRADGRIANPVFTTAYAGQALSTFGQYALLLLTPLILDARGWTAGSIGLALSALTIGMIVMGPLGGRLGDRVGRRRVSTVGLSVAAVAMGAMALSTPAIEPPALIAGLAVFGLGLGVTTPNLMSAALGSVPADRTGAAAGILSTARYLGSIGASIAIGASVTAAADGSGLVFAVGTGCLAVAVLTARRLPDRAASPLPPPDAGRG